MKKWLAQHLARTDPLAAEVEALTERLASLESRLDLRDGAEPWPPAWSGPSEPLSLDLTDEANFDERFAAFIALDDESLRGSEASWKHT